MEALLVTHGLVVLYPLDGIYMNLPHSSVPLRKFGNIVPNLSNHT